MTRVQKYHRYREEIANMKVEDNSQKLITSRKVEKILTENSSSRINYSDLVDAYGINYNNKNIFKKKISVDQILYIFVSVVIVGTLLVLFILL